MLTWGSGSSVFQPSEWKGHVRTPKSGRLRYVPLTARLTAALRDERHLKGPRVLCENHGSPLTMRAVQGLVLRAARRASLRNGGVHVLRHTFCSHLAMRGAPARAIQELAGHRDLVTIQRYMHLSPAAIESAIRLLDEGAGRGNMVATVPATIANINSWKEKDGCGGAQPAVLAAVVCG
jgi:integrase